MNIRKSMVIGVVLGALSLAAEAQTGGSMSGPANGSMAHNANQGCMANHGNMTGNHMSGGSMSGGAMASGNHMAGGSMAGGDHMTGGAMSGGSSNHMSGDSHMAGNTNCNTKQN